MHITPKKSTVTVTLVGKFKPSIFTPGWFYVHDLLSKEELSEAVLQIAHPQVCEFNVKDLHLRVDENRFQLAAAKAPFDRVCQIAVDVFRKHFPDTSLRLFGINQQVHFVVKNSMSRDKIIRSLAPTGVWEEGAKEANIRSESFEMLSIQMAQTKIENRPPKDAINVIVEPSNRFGEGERGIYVAINDHYEGNDQETDKIDLITKLENRFNDSLQQSENLINYIASLQDS